jgi:hypothetical protein
MTAFMRACSEATKRRLESRRGRLEACSTFFRESMSFPRTSLHGVLSSPSASLAAFWEAAVPHLGTYVAVCRTIASRHLQSLRGVKPLCGWIVF